MTDLDRQNWHPSHFKEAREQTSETFQITDGTVSIVSHDREATIWWAQLMIARGLAPQILSWTHNKTEVL